MLQPTLHARASGVLLHPTSLPAGHGIGDLGRSSYQFLHFLADAGQRWWQMLPLGPTGSGNSPYSALSTFAGNPLLISLDQLAEQGLLKAHDVKPVETPFPTRINYPEVVRFKEAKLIKAFQTFRRRRRSREFEAFHAYSVENERWLRNFALFNTIKRIYGGVAWTDWAPPLRDRHREALADVYDRYRESVSYHQFLQFILDRQWSAFKRDCATRGIGLIGDVPMYVAHDSADVWANQPLFCLAPDGHPAVVAGVPPDYFSRTGQIWGNPLYRWPAHRLDDYRWWIDRIRSIFTRFDVARMDHFIGFHRYWEIPAQVQTAQSGQWLAGPGADFFERVEATLGKLELIAEDLGHVTPEVRALAARFDFPGIRVLQFAFGSDDPRDEHRPENYPARCVVYTGTHDNNTTVGWFSELCQAADASSHGDSKSIRDRVLKYVGSVGKDIHWDFIRVALMSPADTAIIPVQDLLGLGTDSRMNFPGMGRGNWEWRLTEDALNHGIAERLRENTEQSGRIRSPVCRSGTPERTPQR